MEKAVYVYPHYVVKMHVVKSQKTVRFLAKGLTHREVNSNARGSNSEASFSHCHQKYRTFPWILKNFSDPLAAGGRRSDCTII